MIYLEGYGLIHLGVETSPAHNIHTDLGPKKDLQKMNKLPSRLGEMMSQCSLRL